MSHGHQCATEVGVLASQTDGLPADAPCCAWCAGITLDCMVPPEAPAKLLKRGRGCAISIVAYSAAREHMKGRNVKITPVPDRVPTIISDNEALNPLEHYGDESCGCPEGAEV